MCFELGILNAFLGRWDYEFFHLYRCGVGYGLTTYIKMTEFASPLLAVLERLQNPCLLHGIP